MTVSQPQDSTSPPSAASSPKRFRVKLSAIAHIETRRTEEVVVSRCGKTIRISATALAGAHDRTCSICKRYAATRAIVRGSVAAIAGAAR